MMNLLDIFSDPHITCGQVAVDCPHLRLFIPFDEVSASREHDSIMFLWDSKHFSPGTPEFCFAVSEVEAAEEIPHDLSPGGYQSPFGNHTLRITMKSGECFLIHYFRPQIEKE